MTLCAGVSRCAHRSYTEPFVTQPGLPVPYSAHQSGAYVAGQPPVYGGQPPASYGGPHPNWGAAQPMQVAPKLPAIALLASFFLPGLGSMMNGEAGKGVGILIGWIVSVLLTVILIGFLGMLGFWIWGMADAYQGARKWNFAHGILS